MTLNFTKKSVVFTVFMIIFNISLFAQNWSEMTKLNSPGYDPGGRFGNSVSISGDYAVIGASKSDKVATNGGAAFVYKNLNGAWTLVQTLTGSDEKDFDLFGTSVSIDGDYIVVGSYANDNILTNSGAAYIFKNNNGVWTEIKKITAKDTQANDNFGYSVCISGEYIVAGAYGKDDAGLDSGCAYVFKNVGDTWNEIKKLNASDQAEKDNFGYSVAISGDNIIVGAYKNDDKGTDCGSAYIYQNNGDTWTQASKIVPTSLKQDDKFGISVSISGNTALIGSPGSDSNANIDIGKAYFYENISNVWTEKGIISQSDAAPYNSFGGSVYVVGTTAIIASYYDDERGSDSGAANIFSNIDGVWTEISKLTASDASVDDKFGWSVALKEDYAIVGAYANDATGVDAGAAYIFTSKLTVSTHPNDTTVCSGSSFIYTIKASGAETYQWEIDSTGTGFIPIENSTVFVNPQSYALRIVKTTIGMDGFKFRCIVKAGAVTETSSAGTLHTKDITPPTITCPNDALIYLIEGQEEYQIKSNKYDVTISSDNCKLKSTLNDKTGTATLNGITIPKGTTNITWTATDESGNTTTCSHNIVYGNTNEVSSLEETGISFYPNPGKNIIYINNKKEKDYILNIYNSAGKKIDTRNVNANPTEIHTEKYSAGIYYFEIKTKKGEVSTKKIVIE